MDWIVTTARTVEEAESRALDLLGVDGTDAEIQVVEEGKTGLFGRTKSEARVRARIKPKAPPAKEERRQGRNGGRNRNRGGGSSNRSRSDNNRKGEGGGRGSRSGADKNRSGKPKDKDRGGRNSGGSGSGGGANSGGDRKPNSSNRARRGGSGSGGGRGRSGGANSGRSGEDRVEMPVAEQRETLETFVAGVAGVFDDKATVTLVEEGTTLQAQVQGEDLGRLVGSKAATLQALEELARTAMHRAAAGRRYHRIQVDVDSYRSRRREALAAFAVELAEAVASSGQSKAMEPMGAADRKLIHDAIADVAGVETLSEGRDPRRYIVVMPTESRDEEE